MLQPLLLAGRDVSRAVVGRERNPGPRCVCDVTGTHTGTRVNFGDPDVRKSVQFQLSQS